MIKYFAIIALFISLINFSFAQKLLIEENGDKLNVSYALNQQVQLSQPEEGLWSIATEWKDDWPASWHHASASQQETFGDWEILSGIMTLPEGEWHIQDAYKKENGRLKCIRRFEWHGDVTLEEITISVRWKINKTNIQAFLPGILYYGNPSGEKNGAHKVPVFHGQPGEAAIFEEHRYPMPFASFELYMDDQHYGAAMHSIPSLVNGGNRNDQWWSLGVKTNDDDSELIMLSGPITYNNEKSVAKALQRSSTPYGDTYTKVKPGTVIEKTFYLELFETSAKGSAFQQPLYTSIDIFKPFYAEDFPTMDEIIKVKYEFAKTRWMEGKDFAGFNMFPEFRAPGIVLGWAGQSEAPVYALQVLANTLDDGDVWKYVQKSMDHICTSPIGDNGFPVRFMIESAKWERPDPVSQGQAMNSIALGIKVGRKNEHVITDQWEAFLQKACEVHSERILSDSWNPRNTAEAFYISPLLIASELFQNGKFKKAALKAADYYAARHLDMSEPYWGGTLDATCEDKEGAWGAFQGFMAAYEHTGEQKYLAWSQHAGDVVLSYTVVWDIPMPPGRMADHFFKSRGWTGVSAQNQHLDVYGVLTTPQFYRLGQLTKNENLMRLAQVMYRSCGQMIDPFGAHGEQIQQTNYTQWVQGNDQPDLRGGYSEEWTVFWITAHFLHAAATFYEMGVKF
jgi:hypothetical protein